MEYFEHNMIFYPEFQIRVSYLNTSSLWLGRISTFPDIYVKSDSLNEVIVEVQKILNERINFIINTEKKTLIKEVRKSEIVIEHQGKYYICIYKFENLYKAISIIRDNQYNIILQERQIDNNMIEELIEKISNISFIPPIDRGLDGHLYNLKVKKGLSNCINITYWSGSMEEWSGLNSVVKALEQIHHKYFFSG